ncbi:MAG: hypothetical protein ACD_2C00152G0007 [uncultured bacterium (gcode 4)]|uniref:Uncharacterized protein n=1 Tax=uncultured bacterium (gcode 4) TaxID=1234023 RepID=K2G2W2_9BACT|nr:MAG: hypothetical protein ACD_2C00152G0007 [uncultured bacterium (gcode 4)]
METQKEDIRTIFSQADYKEELERMQLRNYHIFRKDEYKALLLRYFRFLENEIVGNIDSKLTDDCLTISLLENYVLDMEMVFTRIETTRQYTREILIRASAN